MFRLLVLVHRYLGIAVGFIVALWCLSGFVMMYVQYPDLDEREYLAGLPPIDTSGCCTVNSNVLERLAGVDAIGIEMLAGRPVLRVRSARDISLVVDLGTGRPLPNIDPEMATRQADVFLAQSGIGGKARFVDLITRDQWTVAGYFDAYRPLYLLAADDVSRTRIYVSSINGETVQVTSSSERLWNLLGAVTHWIYPTALRQNLELWSQAVIWLSIVSLFLVLVGICLGIRQFRFAANGSRSPYRGLKLWHHYAGLLSGLFTVTWLASGLLSMNPWGAFAGDDGSEERSRLAGRAMSSAEIAGIVAALGNNTLPAATVRLASSLIDGKLALLAQDSRGNVLRLDAAALGPAPLPEDIWQRVAVLVRPDASAAQAGLIDSGDDYYFSHHEQAALPVYRIVFDDAGQTRYYFDAISAELVEKYDSGRRAYRWLFLAPHRGDFAALMRERPLWDLILLSLLLGVTVGAVSGVWLGYRRLTQ